MQDYLIITLQTNCRIYSTMALPALLKRSTLPRISSPLATHSSSYSLSNESDTSSGSDDDDEGSDSESAGGSDSDDDDDEQVGRLKSLLQKAKDAARAREQPAEASEVVFDSDALKESGRLNQSLPRQQKLTF